MAKKKRSVADVSWKGVVKWGGVALAVAAVVPIVFVALVLGLNQTLPLPAREVLESPAIPTAIFALAIIGELLLIPGGLALYFALKRIENTFLFFATALWMASALMFVISRGLIFAISMISGRYLAASGIMRASYIASAELALEIQSVFSTTALLLLCAASIIIGFVMLKGGFGKYLGYLAITAGIITIFTPFAVIIGIPLIIPFIGLIITALWQLIAGIKLYQLGK